MPLSKPSTRLLIIAAVIAAIILAWAWLPAMLTPKSIYRLTPGQIPRIVTLPDQDPAVLSGAVLVPSGDPLFPRGADASLYPVHIGRKDLCVTWSKFPPELNAPIGFIGQLQLNKWVRLSDGSQLPAGLSPMIFMNFTQAQFDSIVGRPLPPEIIDAFLSAASTAKPGSVEPVFVPWPTK